MLFLFNHRRALLQRGKDVMIISFGQRGDQREGRHREEENVLAWPC
jgi:hypothetical protein